MPKLVSRDMKNSTKILKNKELFEHSKLVCLWNAQICYAHVCRALYYIICGLAQYD